MDTLIVITGPTGVGKSDVAIEVASSLGTEILSADSRQIYAGIPVTTAAPSSEQLRQVPHHFVGCLPLDAYYSAALFEQQALALLPDVFARCGGVAVMCGGSMMYVDAVCHGLDALPTVSDTVRARVAGIRETRGEQALLDMLNSLDPEYGALVDRNNIKRVMHALEICLEAGVTYTSLRGRPKDVRPFRVLKFMLTAPRPVLFDRINARTSGMLAAGMEAEVRSVSHLRHLNSLNTVGFKEMFRYIDGEWTLDEAVARLQKNTRVYAKKQLTWYARDPHIRTLDITVQKSAETILGALDDVCNGPVQSTGVTV